MSSTISWSKQLQPRYVSGFRCIGPDCEDTCCSGWRVAIDQETYEMHQECFYSDLRSAFNQLVTIETEKPTPNAYAWLNPSDSGCAFLLDRLCSIQTKLGGAYLPKTCATYPRAFHAIGGVLETTLDLSCPEAARLALSSPSAMDLVEVPPENRAEHSQRFFLPENADADLPHPAFHEARAFVISLLRNRAYPLWQRLHILGYFCDDIDKLAAANADRELPAVMTQYEQAIDAGLFTQALNASSPIAPASQLEIVLELIVGRISSDFTSRRFLDCYQELMYGLHWTMQSSMEDLGRSFSLAYSAYYASVEQAHPYILENYLINYVCKTLFPFGTKTLAEKLNLTDTAAPASRRFHLLASYYAIIHTVAVGMAGFRKAAFNPGHLRKVVQSCIKAFEHSVTHPCRVLEILVSKGISDPASCAVLLNETGLSARHYAMMEPAL